MADYIYLVQMDIPAELEAEFNRIYDTEHVPNIVQAPGVHSCTRYRLESTNAPGMARYAAVYAIDSPDVPGSAGWLAEWEKGTGPPGYGHTPRPVAEHLERSHSRGEEVSRPAMVRPGCTAGPAQAPAHAVAASPAASPSPAHDRRILPYCTIVVQSFDHHRVSASVPVLQLLSAVTAIDHSSTRQSQVSTSGLPAASFRLMQALLDRAHAPDDTQRGSWPRASQT